MAAAEYHVLIDHDSGYWSAEGIEGLEMRRYQVADPGRAGYTRITEEVPILAIAAARSIGSFNLHFHHTNSARRALDRAA